MNLNNRGARVFVCQKLARMLCSSLTCLCVTAATAYADEATLRDVNGDGTVRILTFGDSITYGVGSAYEPGDFVEQVESSGNKGGYPDRLEAYLGVPVFNVGIPGELLTGGGVERFASKVAGQNYDIVLIMEGSNDAFPQTSLTEYSHALQKMINVAIADGKHVVVMTIAPSSGLHSGLLFFTESYSRTVRDLAAINQISLVDVERGLTDACGIVEDCYLFLQPEGLHPNNKGYDAVAQLVAARLLNIDIAAPDSASQIASAVGIPVQDVLVGNK
jgi:lysophospholipase L1-like esterase